MHAFEFTAQTQDDLLVYIKVFIGVLGGERAERIWKDDV